MSLSNQLLETALRLDELYSEGGQKTSLLFLVKYKKSTLLNTCLISCKWKLSATVH